MSLTKAEGLRGNEFETYFNKLPQVSSLFLKVCSIDQIPSEIPIKHFVLFNLSKQHEEGSHWALLLRYSKHKLEIFNSLGSDNLNYLNGYLQFDKHFKIDFNKKSVQSLTSTYCGFFCIYFAIFRILNFDMTMEHVLEDIFTSNLIKNDLIVSQFCNNILTSVNDDFFCFHDI